MEKRIVERDGQYCVESETTGRGFGCYSSRSAAQDRLDQIERFKSAGPLEIARTIFADGDGEVLVADVDAVGIEIAMAAIEGVDQFVVIGKALPEVVDLVAASDPERLFLFGDCFVVTSGAADRIGAEPVSKMESVRLLKATATEEEHFVLGIVLEPDTEDAQGDIYSKEEVRKAAHWYMEHGRKHGLQHKKDVSDKITLLENYIAPGDFEIGEQSIKSGTWLQGVRVNDDDLWESVKTGEITGFSIGGTAIRRRA